jgi:phage shock protein C
MFAGVCGGLGEYIVVDPTVVRLLTTVIALSTGVGAMLLVYFIMMIIIPEAPSNSSVNEDAPET